MAAERYSSEVLRMFYGPIAEQENANLPQPLSGLPEISDQIKNLPPEIREIILKEYISIKISEREDMGWNDVHFQLSEAPFCDVQKQIVRVSWCRKCNICGLDGLCALCLYLEGKKHHIDNPFCFDSVFWKAF